MSKGAAGSRAGSRAGPRAGPRAGAARVDHIGVAVRSIDASLGFYEGVLGLSCEHVEEVADQGVRAAFLRAGDTKVELIEPTRADSAVGRFLEKRGEGMHHLAFRVEDAAFALAQAKGQGLRLVDEVPRRGARGCLVGFLHPSSTHGVLVEYVEDTGAPSGDAKAHV